MISAVIHGSALPGGEGFGEAASCLFYVYLLIVSMTSHSQSICVEMNSCLMSKPEPRHTSIVLQGEEAHISLTNSS